MRRTKRIWWCVAGVLLAMASAGCRGDGETPAGEPAADHRSQIEAWRQQRDRSLREPDGWLTLAGLYWLGEGENSFGSGAGNDIVFPAGEIGESGGLLRRDGREVTLLPSPGAGLGIEGARLSAPTVLSPDTSEEGPTIVEKGSLSFYVIERGDSIGIRLKDSKSPVLTSFTGMDYFAVEPEWRVNARYERFDEPRVLRTPTILGTVSEEEIYGELVFEVEGEVWRLQPSGDPEGFFVVFGDQTNGSETYGGGRFVYAEPVQKDGTVVIDFNKAYCPPCVFTPYATCPLPPVANKLPFRLEAGEKMFGTAH